MQHNYETFFYNYFPKFCLSTRCRLAPIRCDVSDGMEVEIVIMNN